MQKKLYQMHAAVPEKPQSSRSVLICYFNPRKHESAALSTFSSVDRVERLWNSEHQSGREFGRWQSVLLAITMFARHSSLTWTAGRISPVLNARQGWK